MEWAAFTQFWGAESENRGYQAEFKVTYRRIQQNY